jgi:hypothetical protein
VLDARQVPQLALLDVDEELNAEDVSLYATAGTVFVLLDSLLLLRDLRELVHDDGPIT